MEEWKYAVKSREEIREKGLMGYYAILIDGKAIFMGKTEADYISDGYEILSEEAFRSLVREHDKRLCKDWTEITANEYEYALNALPPENWFDGGFFFSEHWSGDITAYYQKYKGKYYTSLQSVKTPRAEIMKSLLSFVDLKKRDFISHWWDIIQNGEEKQ